MTDDLAAAARALLEKRMKHIETIRPHIAYMRLKKMQHARATCPACEAKGALRLHFRETPSEHNTLRARVHCSRCNFEVVE